MSSTIRRLTLGALLAGSAWLALTALDGAAHADDTPAPVVQQSRGPLDDLTGTVGSVVEVVDQVLPDPPKSEPTVPVAEPEPADAEPEPSEDTDHGTDEQDGQQAAGGATDDTAPADPIGDILDGVTDTAGGIVEVITTPPPPVVIPPVVVPTPTMPPATTPAPITTTAPDAADTQTSTPAVETATEPATDTTVEPAPTDLPVPIGPVIGRTLDDGIHPAEPTTPAPGEVRQCDGLDALDLDDIRRTIRGSIDTTTTTTQPDRADRRDDRPCPSGPGGPVAQNGAMAAVTGGTTHHGDQTCGDTPARLTWPALARLHQLRARGDLPAGRCTHIEPGPA